MKSILRFPAVVLCRQRKGIWSCGRPKDHDGDCEGYDAFLRKAFSWPRKVVNDSRLDQKEGG